jgi:cytochrome c553
LAVAIGAGVMVMGAAAAWSTAANQEPGAEQIANMGVVSQGAQACASCHGFRGEGVQAQNGPRLAGLDAGYIERQLQAFARGGRDSQVMTSEARSLTPGQRRALSRYYAGLPPTTTAAEAASGDESLGRSIASEGNWSEKVPPCASCHGADGLGVDPVTPPLAGQRADYLERQLMGFRDGDRRDDPLGLMRGVARRLTPREIRVVAAYYSTLPPKPGPQR